MFHHLAIEQRAAMNRLAVLGYRIVPLKWGKKIPRAAGWQQLGSTPADVDSFFAANGYGPLNVGVRGGEQQDGTPIVIVDFDRPDRFGRWLAETKVNTMLVETRRGFHAYLRGSSDNRKFDGGDLISRSNKFAVAPCSWVRETGHVYRFVSEIRAPSELAPFDPAMFPGLEKPRPPPKSPRLVRANLDRRVEWAREKIGRIYSVEGQGGDRALFVAACILIQRYRLDYRTALELLEEWNSDGHARPPWATKRLHWKLSEAQRLLK